MTRRDVLVRQRQLAALKAYVDEGSMKAAAHSLGLTESAVRKRITAYCLANDTSLPAAIYELGRTEHSHFENSERGGGM